jgi:hypothetical protein
MTKLLTSCSISVLASKNEQGCCAGKLTAMMKSIEYAIDLTFIRKVIVSHDKLLQRLMVL